MNSNESQSKTQTCFTLVSYTKTRLGRHDETVKKIKKQHYWSRQEAADKDYCLFARVFVCQYLNWRTEKIIAGIKQRKSREKNKQTKNQQNQDGQIYSGDIGKFKGRKLDASATQYWTSASVKYGPSPPSRWFLTSDHWCSLSYFWTIVPQSFRIVSGRVTANAVISAAQLNVLTACVASWWMWVTSFGWAATATRYDDWNPFILTYC